jgi:predicted nucleotide-binding protein
MSKRTSIVKALSEKFKEIDGTGQYKTNLFQNSFPKLKFWDEVQDFPCVYMHPGQETRDYLPSNFTWGMLNVCVKVYVRSEDNAQELLEELLDDLELCIDLDNNLETTEILILNITTDEGLLAPYGVGEINLEVRYALT